MEPHLIIIIVIGVIAGGGLFLLVIDKLVKGEIRMPKKTQPKPEVQQGKVKEVKEVEVVEVKEESIFDKYDGDDERKGEKPTTGRGKRILDYHHKRWGERRHIGHIGHPNEEEETTLTEDEIAKIIAFKDLFNKKE